MPTDSCTQACNKAPLLLVFQNHPQVGGFKDLNVFAITTHERGQDVHMQASLSRLAAGARGGGHGGKAAASWAAGWVAGRRGCLACPCCGSGSGALWLAAPPAPPAGCSSVPLLPGPHLQSCSASPLQAMPSQAELSFQQFKQRKKALEGAAAQDILAKSALLVQWAAQRWHLWLCGGCTCALMGRSTLQERPAGPLAPRPLPAFASRRRLTQ